eukprot:85914-Amphidinium_carterae.1
MVGGPLQVMRQASAARLLGRSPTAAALGSPAVATTELTCSLDPLRFPSPCVSQLGVQQSATPLYSGLASSVSIPVRSHASLPIIEMDAGLAGGLKQLPQPVAPPRRSATPSPGAWAHNGSAPVPLVHAPAYSSVIAQPGFVASRAPAPSLTQACAVTTMPSVVDVHTLPAAY